MFEHKPLTIGSTVWYRFRPAPDITAYELACIFSAAGMQVDQDSLDALERALWRHFEREP